MATQVFTSFETQGKSVFDTLTVKQIKLGDDYCGNSLLTACEFCALQDSVKSATESAFCAYNKAEEAYCLAWKAYYCSSGSSNYCGSGSSNYCGDYCSSGSSSYCSSDIPIIAYSPDSASACCPPQHSCSIAIGSSATVDSDRSIAIGLDAFTMGHNGGGVYTNSGDISIGTYAGTVFRSIAIGPSSFSNLQSIAIGSDSRAYCSYKGIAIGDGANVAASNYSVAIGCGAYIYPGGCGYTIDSASISIGTKSSIYGCKSIVLGSGGITKLPNSSSIFAGIGPNGYGDNYSVRFTQVAGSSLDTTQYIFQLMNACRSEYQGVKISATNFFNLLKQAGGEEYNVSPMDE